MATQLLPFHVPEIAEDEIQLVVETLRSGWLTTGPKTKELEERFAQYVGTRHAIAVNSCTAALHLALDAVGIREGDEVLVPAFTAVPTAAAVCAVGATPVFVDVDASTAAVDPSSWAAARTARTRAIIVVHLYGRAAELPDIDLPVIEDAAQAHGALDPSARRGLAIAWSFYPTKNLGGIGDGGAVTTDDDALMATIRTLRVHGMTEQYVHVARSQNFRMSDLEAGWLRLVLPHLSADNDRRRAVTAAYRQAAPGLVWHADHPRHVHHLAVFRSAMRDETRRVLAEAGVSTAIHYPLALTHQPAYRALTRTACPQAEAWAAECVTVPCFAEMTDDEVSRVADALAALPGAAA